MINLKCNSVIHSKISFKARNNLLIEKPPAHPGWAEPNLVQKAMKLRYPIATTLYATGLMLSNTGEMANTAMALKTPLMTFMTADLVATTIDKKRIPLQGKSEHESAHWLVNNSQIDQRYSTEINIPRFPDNLSTGGHCKHLNTSSPTSREEQLKVLIGAAATSDAPGALSELKRGYSIPVQFQALPGGDFTHILKSTWAASKITSGDSGITPRRVQDFCEITQGVRDTSKAMIKQHDPEVIDEFIDFVRDNNGISSEKSHYLAEKRGIYKLMPELAPALTAKLERLDNEYNRRNG